MVIKKRAGYGLIMSTKIKIYPPKKLPKSKALYLQAFTDDCAI